MKYVKCTKSGIYRFISTDNKVIYTGSAKCLDTRLKSHFSPKGSHLPKEVYNNTAIVEIIPMDTYGDALAAEQWAINHYKCRYNKRDKAKNIDVKIDPKYDYLDNKWKVYWKLKPLDKDKIEANKRNDTIAIIIAYSVFILAIGMFILRTLINF